jgi:hypothetical protein
MKVLVVLPLTLESITDLKRRIDWIRRRFEDRTVMFAAKENLVCQYISVIGEKVSLYDFTQLPADTSILVIMQGSGQPEYADVPKPEFVGRLYFQERNGRLALQNQQFDQLEIDDVEAHVFSRGAPRNKVEYYYFPYGYAVHWPGLGPVNSFGFRNSVDWRELAVRDKSHKVIVVSGASAVWSQCCIHYEAFPAVLERMLNDWCRENDSTLRFTVVNLGLFGNLILHQITNYILFGERLHPDYVLAHDGFNDLLFGLMSDPWLISEHSISYQPEFEWWGQLLHNTPPHLLTHSAQPFAPVNLPHVVVRSYVERKDQFRRIVEGMGTEFVWGFQPCVLSKGEGSPEEQKTISAGHPYYGLAYHKIGFLFDNFTRLARLPAGVTFVDCHKAFKAFGKDQHLFEDIAHTTNLGDLKLAQLYFDVFRRKFE